VPESRIFIVDDDPAVRDSIQALLRSAGYAARKFGSAKEFLAEGHVTVPQSWLATRAPVSHEGKRVRRNGFGEDYCRRSNGA
jgi:DNA-binding response OmpR family regulator